jgi:hypothetical protein
LRALVCGGRDFADRDLAFGCLDRFHATHPIKCVIHGAARGADTLGAEWATARGVPVEPYPADWKRHGRAAGPIRNAAMLANGKPAVVVAFPGGQGHGAHGQDRHRVWHLRLAAEGAGRPAARARERRSPE